VSVERSQECTTLMRRPKGAAHLDARQCDGRRSPSTTDLAIAGVDEPIRTGGHVSLQRVVCHSAVMSAVTGCTTAASRTACLSLH